MTVADLVEAQVRRTPAADAVVAGDGVLSYAELDDRANRLARHLQDLGVGADVLVGVCLERSLDMAVALLGVLKAGGACVPLDPTYPPGRLAFMVDDAALAAVLTQASLADRVSTASAPVVRLDTDGAAWAGRPAGVPPRRSGADDAAYVIYTSGSTGQPKGVVLTQRNVANHQRVAADLYGLRPGDRVLQFCSIGFDVSIEEIFPTWAAGATVVLRPDDAPLLGRSWVDWLQRERVTVANLPTAYWHEWVRDLAALGTSVPEDLRLVVVGGEKALGSVYRTWDELSDGKVRWINAYGPTEATCMVTVYEPPVGQVLDGDPPIGRPLPGASGRVVDQRGEPVAPGDVGELLIGGIGLARGYLHRPELTAQRFVADPDAGRAYRTGDLVRLRGDGNLEFVGRVDEQVKVRGFRIECGEIEAVLDEHPAVSEAVVVARPDGTRGNRLVGYVVPARGVEEDPAGAAATDAIAASAGGARASAADLRAFLGQRLPGYMVPSVVVFLDALPLTANGKVDRDALPQPVPAGTGSGPGATAPRTPTEERVAEIWARVLDVGRVGVDDDFFALGGHSLLATQVIARLREDLGTDTPLRAIFEAPTVAGLAAAIDAAAGGDGGPQRTAEDQAPLGAVPRPPGARFPLSLAQEQMWRLEMAADPPGLQNVTAFHRFRRPVDQAALRAALAAMVERHEGLRTTFTTESGRPVQVVAPTAEVALAVTDLGALPGPAREAERARLVARHNAAPFDLERAPLLRAELVLGGDEHHLVATFDHLVCDGTSAYVFLSELSSAYEAVVAGREPELARPEIQFVDYAVWQRRRVTGDMLEDQLDWWRKELDGMPLGPAVPFDRMPGTPTRRIGSWPLVIEAGTYHRLHDLARSTQSTLFVLCAASVQTLCHRASGTTDVVLSTTLSGRQRAEFEGLMGMFAGIGRIRTDLGGDPTFAELVARTRDTVLGLFEHQDVPFMRVRQALFPDFPTEDPVAVAASVPVELQYFHTAHDHWSPGVAVVERPGADRGDRELYFRGQLHPLSITLLDDGTQLWGELSAKLDFYDESTLDALARALVHLLDAVAADPTLPLSRLPRPT